MTHRATIRTTASRATAAGLLALLGLAGCAQQRTETEPIAGPGRITSEAAEMPPELPREAGETGETSPPLGDRPPRYQRIRGAGDVPAPPPPAPVFPPTPPQPGLQSGTPPAPPPSAAATGMREVFPHIRLDTQERVVEFDGAVAWDVHDPDTPKTYLELVVCTPDTKEHESLVVSRARPSNVHAALLLLGLEPGAPGSFTWEGERLVPVDPTGPPLDVRLVLNPGAPSETLVDPLTWIVNDETGESFATQQPAAAGRPGWVFAGSRVVKRDLGSGEQDHYLADGGDGALVGLTTFGSETIAWHKTISPDASVNEPEWIAKVAAVPRLGTPVTVRVRPWSPPPAATATP